MATMVRSGPSSSPARASERTSSATRKPAVTGSSGRRYGSRRASTVSPTTSSEPSPAASTFAATGWRKRQTPTPTGSAPRSDTHAGGGRRPPDPVQLGERPGPVELARPQPVHQVEDVGRLLEPQRGADRLEPGGVVRPQRDEEPVGQGGDPYVRRPQRPPQPVEFLFDVMDGQAAAQQGFAQFEQQTAERVGRGVGAPDRGRLAWHGRYRPIPPESVRLCPGLFGLPPFPAGPAAEAARDTSARPAPVSAPGQ